MTRSIQPLSFPTRKSLSNSFDERLNVHFPEKACMELQAQVAAGEGFSDPIERFKDMLQIGVLATNLVYGGLVQVYVKAKELPEGLKNRNSCPHVLSVWANENGRVISVQGCSPSGRPLGQWGQSTLVGCQVKDALERIHSQDEKHWREGVSLAYPPGMVEFWPPPGFS